MKPRWIQSVSEKLWERSDRILARSSNQRRRKRREELRRRRIELDLDWMESPADEEMLIAFQVAARMAEDFGQN